jgi:hypothetical protein
LWKGAVTMRKTKENINNIREEIIFQGHANTQEIQAFIPCGYKEATKIKNEIIEKIKKNGKTVLVSGRRVYIKPVHLLDYIDMTEKQIHEYAKMEREKVVNGRSG